MSSKWWGSFDIPLGGGRQWRIGPCHLQLHRTELELRAVLWREDSAHDPALAVAAEIDEEPPENASLYRFGFRHSPERVHLQPAPADRALIASPDHPFYLPPREEALIYVSSPVWLRVHTGDPTAPLLEEPLFRPSDIWFGPSTRTGELAYASRTTARLNLENVPILCHRAISAVDLDNQAPTLLQLDRLRLPARNLSLHCTPGGHLWTETVVLEREEDGDFAALRTEDRPPKELGQMEFVCAARERAARGALLRSFGLALRREF